MLALTLAPGELTVSPPVRINTNQIIIQQGRFHPSSLKPAFPHAGKYNDITGSCNQTTDP